ncbi:hypothetical protein KJ596_00845 [Patescibacteria group bacterium]|nr:hypothetical protein [Patescibacteria group bacterium]MBU1868324.1 hypothetical protein [Patescibacteria group bacterium]
MRLLDLKSKQSIADFFEILEGKRYIIRQGGIRLTEKAIQRLMDREIRSLGLEFVPLFDFFPTMLEKENSTATMSTTSGSENIFVKKGALVEGALEGSGFTTSTEVEPDMRLSAPAGYLIAGINIGGTKIEIHANKLVIQNAAGNIINGGGHTEIGSRSYKLSVMGRLRLGIKAGFDKLLGLFG